MGKEIIKDPLANDMKIVKITSIYKKGDPTQCTNYRPIAVLPMFSKIWEPALLSRLTRFLETQNILDNSQYGFRKGRNTIDAVRAVLNIV